MSNRNNSLGIQDLINDRSKWCKLIKCYIVKTSLTKVETEMQDLINRYNKDEVYKQVLIDYSEKQKAECQDNDVLFAWRIFSVIHDRKIRTEINSEVKRVEKQKRDAEGIININRARVILEAVNKGRSKYRYEKRQIQELREHIVLHYKENLKKLEALENKCYDQNKISVEFYESMDAQRSEAKRLAEVTWSELDEVVRKSKYLDDYNMFKNEFIEGKMTKWILTKEDDPYVQYCTKIHLSGIEPAETKELEEEIQQMINDHNLSFLNSESLEDIINRNIKY